MPVVPVRDLVIQPREQDLVVGTHGRGLWLTDIGVLHEMTEEVLAKPAHLFAVAPRGWRVESGWGNYRLFGDDILATPNEPNGITIDYWLNTAAPPATVRIADAAGNLVRALRGPEGQGLLQLLWNLRDERNQLVEPGNYTVTLEAAGQTLTQRVTVKEPVVLPRPRG